jgi:hypothetical protein
MRNLNSYIKLDDGTNSNFKYYEFVKSSTAKRFNIYNIPTSDIIWNNIENLVKNILQPIRDYFGPIRITSGYRSLELNLKIGGSSTSNHVFGFAADIEPIDYDIPLIDIVNFIYKELEYKELICEYFPDGWVHVAYEQENNKKQLKLKDLHHSYDVVSIDYINSIY